MGVMGRVRRHCDAVTAFMFQPKAQDPRDNPSDPSDQITEILKANVCCKVFLLWHCFNTVHQQRIELHSRRIEFY